jgi:hypothetical protein
MTIDDVRNLVGKPLRSRAMIAYALCVIAEEEMRAGRQMKALETISLIRRIVADISVQLDSDTSARPISDVRGAQELMSGVDERLNAIEALLGPRIVH